MVYGKMKLIIFCAVLLSSPVFSAAINGSLNIILITSGSLDGSGSGEAVQLASAHVNKDDSLLQNHELAVVLVQSTTTPPSVGQFLL